MHASTDARSLIFHYFPITDRFDSSKCRQFSVLGLTRGSLGSFYTAIVRRPLISLAGRLYTTKRLLVQSGHLPYFLACMLEHVARRAMKYAITSTSLFPRLANFLWCHSSSTRNSLRSQLDSGGLSGRGETRARVAPVEIPPSTSRVCPSCSGWTPQQETRRRHPDLAVGRGA